MGEKKSKSLEHLLAAQSSGLKLSAYAAQHQIDVRRLYEVKRKRAQPGASSWGVVRVKAEAPAQVTPKARECPAPGAASMQARAATVADLGALRERAHSFAAFPVLGFVDADVTKGGVPAKFYPRHSHHPITPGSTSSRPGRGTGAAVRPAAARPGRLSTRGPGRWTRSHARRRIRAASPNTPGRRRSPATPQPGPPVPGPAMSTPGPRRCELPTGQRAGARARR